MEETSETKPRSGSILISEPFLGDPNFERSVILLCNHEEEGTFGLVLNRMSNLKLSDVIDVFDKSFDVELGIGGPVQYNTLHYVHRLASLPDAIQLGEEVYWGGDFEALKAMISAGTVTTSDIRFFFRLLWVDGRTAPGRNR